SIRDARGPVDAAFAVPVWGARPKTSWVALLARRDQHEVIPVDHLVAALVAEEPFDLPRLRALDLPHLGRRVVHEAARELAAVGSDAADAIAHAEAALDGPHPGREQAPSALGERALRALVEEERAAGLQGVRDPVLAAGERVAVGDEQRAG